MATELSCFEASLFLEGDELRMIGRIITHTPRGSARTRRTARPLRLLQPKPPADACRCREIVVTQAQRLAPVADHALMATLFACSAAFDALLARTNLEKVLARDDADDAAAGVIDDWDPADACFNHQVGDLTALRFGEGEAG
jgi:hypothetical protein